MTLPKKLLVPVALVVIAGAAIVAFLRRDVPVTYDDVQEHFKYGSIGSEGRSGIPYYLWLVLPRVFPEYLPQGPGDGYARFGFIYEHEGDIQPIGISMREQPFKTVGLNCAVCHTGTVQGSDGRRQIILGMPAGRIDLQAYQRFLFAAGRDDRFNPDVLIPAIQEAAPSFSWFEALAYRFVVIPRAREGLLKQAENTSWFDSRPPQGPGRVDTFNPYKVLLNLDISTDRTVGTADLPSIWNQRPRDGLWLHWDGNNDSVDERNKSAAIGAGATPDSLDIAALDRVASWIQDLQAPPFPEARINRTLAERGGQVYQANCASCHSFGGSQIGQVTPIDRVRTDPERLNSFTADLAQKMLTLGTGKPWQFRHFRKTNGYANMPLDGLWLRAPYLHNGSVPTLRDLLSPSNARPRVFYRGSDEYDFGAVGFISTGAAAERSGFRFDTSVPGNGNGGHEYGTNLSPEDKDALIEYLKTE
jgi:mono/diheme cytochrome c family protein